MRRGVLAFGVPVLLAAVVGAAQPPAAPPGAPVLPPVPPAGAAPPLPLPTPGAPGAPVAPPTPAVPADTPLARFEPLTAYPSATQFAVLGALRGGAWAANAQQPNGRFLHGYNPALRRPLPGEHDLAQARAARALAAAAKFAADERHAAGANQAVLALLAGTKVPPADPAVRVPVNPSLVCNRVGCAAALALALYELPNPGAKPLDDAEKLCEFLRRAVRPDGSVHHTDGPTDDPARTDPAGANEHPGAALHALAVSNRFKPADWKKEAVKRGLAHYRARFRAAPHPVLAASLLPAAAELHAQTKLPEAAAAAFELADWLCGAQIGPTDPKVPQGAGGFRTYDAGKPTDALPTAADTGRCVEALACAYQLARDAADLTREAKYKPALVGAVEFLCGLQFSEPNTRHFENGFRAAVLIGGFHHTPTDGTLYTEGTACAVTGLVRFLSSGAEKR